jgi:hydrogenase maturation protease
LGNPILSDDGVGNRIAEILQREISDPEVTATETNAVGLNLLDLLVGYQRAIIIDAVKTREGKVGQVYRLTPENLRISQHLCSPHDVDFTSTLELGKRLGLSLPDEIIILAVEVADITNFSESLTPEVEKAVPEVIQMVLDELANPGQQVADEHIDYS